MKKYNIFLLFLFTALIATAIPAKRGVWRTLQLNNGKTVQAQLCGDEHLHFFVDAQGERYVADGQSGLYKPVNEQFLKQRLMCKRTRSTKVATNSLKKIGVVDKTIFQGTQRGLIILVEFDNKEFQPNNDQAFWNRVANEEGYNDQNGFRGSLRDYFHDQSFGQFTLEFDVVGPVRMPHDYAYYGTNDDEGEDLYPGEMVVTACTAVADQVNYSDYDWDNDGAVDQVYILYAGEGEHESLDGNTIWPHAWTLEESDYGQALVIDGVTVNSYACSNELKSDGTHEGIGTMCHEFSHCMGFPDMYDILYSGNYGMGCWDLMNDGSYAGDGFCPVGYTAYERMMCGWMEPIELIGDTIINNIEPSIDGGNTYIIYNKANRDEFYMLEHRAQKSWDTFLPAQGMLVTHIDFDSTLWACNVVNTIGDFNSVFPGVSNDHQRITIVHADNDDDSNYYSAMTGSYYKKTEDTDLYPYLHNDSLSNYSTPQAILYNKNLNGRRLLNVSINGIERGNDGLMSFNFIDFSTTVHEPQPGELFYESFNGCNGIGGNDSIFSGGSVGIGTFMPDNEDWIGLAMGGANQCVKSGTNTKSGKMTTPEFDVDSIATFSFLAAPYGNDGTNLTLNINGTASITPTSFTLVKGQWTQCVATITGSGTVTVDIIPVKRMFLDEVMAFAPVSAIYGDVNHDGYVNSADVTALYNYLLNNDSTGIANGDIDGDGFITSADVTAIYNILLNN